jgi:heme exporter protein C
VLAATLACAAIALIFFWVPEDADQGFSQKIFYFHVPIAITAYACFGWGAFKAFMHLWKRTPAADLQSYVAIHLGVIFGALTLVTGSIWAKASWGVWWTWSSQQLVLFLVPSSSIRPTSCCASRWIPGPRARMSRPSTRSSASS